MPERKFLKKNPSSYVLIASLSDQGKVRQNNEDRLAVQNYVTAEKHPRHVLLAVLSDGVGGNRAGEVAAQIGVDTIVTLFSNITSLVDPVNILKNIIISANLAVLEASNTNAEFEGMGATCICALVLEKTLYLANLGDSRAYLLRGRTIRQLNYDHTLLEDTLGLGSSGSQSITRSHPLAHVLSRYLGSAHPPMVDTRLRAEKRILSGTAPTIESLDLMTNDYILLCSDGLTDMLTDKDIKDIVKGKDIEKDTYQLVNYALEKGGLDNVSVILLKIP